MKKNRHDKQILLFLITIILPSLGLIFLTVRMVMQDRELADRRATDARHLIARQIGDQLLARLENIKQQAAEAFIDGNMPKNDHSSFHPDIEFVCPIQGLKPILPWEQNREKGKTAYPFQDPGLQSRLQQGEKEEFVRKNYTRAYQLYHTLLIQSRSVLKKNTLYLMMARTLIKSSQHEKALIYYKKVLNQPFIVVDENGIPLALYAARQIQELQKAGMHVVNTFYSGLPYLDGLSLSAVFMMREILDAMMVSPPDTVSRYRLQHCRERVYQQIRKKEQLIALQKDYSTLGLSSYHKKQSELKNQSWVLYGEEPWLMSTFIISSVNAPFLIGISVEKFLDVLRDDQTYASELPVDFQFVDESNQKGFNLGPNFQRIKIVYGENEQYFLDEWKIHPAFYMLALILILGITLFGSYLLWRDMRREVQLADMRSQFVSSVSHELKTPLTSIRMFAETMRMNRLKDKKMKTEFLDTIVNESQRLTRLLNNVLDFSRIEKGKRIYRFQRASLYMIIESACQAMVYPFNQQGFKLHVQTEEKLPEVYADSDAIEQAILNLLHNGMKYSGESKEIQLILKRDNHKVFIQVIDHGIGISFKDQKHIFKQFYRVPSADNERIAGTGLGLALVKHIVEAHKGALTVESSPGKGSTFTIALPLEES